MKNLNNTNWGKRAGRIGYALAGNVRDNCGRNWKYRAASFDCGPISYFNSLADLCIWIRRVEEVRLMVDAPERHILGIEVGAYPIRPLWNVETR